jgi:serine/threonine protein kinase
MTAEQWSRINSLLEQALELKGEDQRGFVESCEDPQTRRELERLLENQPRADRLLSVTAWTGRGEGATAAAPERVGPYRITRELGQGGMGTVYLGQRNDGEFRREAAIKVVRPGLNQGGLIARFRRERQILAQLQHPGIAALFDGGVRNRASSFSPCSMSTASR